MAVWTADPSSAGLERMVQQLTELYARNPRGVYLLNVITKSCGIPTPDVRATILRQFVSMRGKLRAAAIVLEKSGIEAALSRAVLSGFVTITKRPFEFKVVDSDVDALRWLEALGADVTPMLAATALELRK